MHFNTAVFLTTILCLLCLIAAIAFGEMAYKNAFIPFRVLMVVGVALMIALIVGMVVP